MGLGIRSGSGCTGPLELGPGHTDHWSGPGGKGWGEHPRGQRWLPELAWALARATASRAKQDTGPGPFCQVCENRSRAWNSHLARLSRKESLLFREVRSVREGGESTCSGEGPSEVPASAGLLAQLPPHPASAVMPDLSCGRRGTAEPCDPDMPVPGWNLGVHVAWGVIRPRKGWTGIRELDSIVEKDPRDRVRSSGGVMKKIWAGGLRGLDSNPGPARPAVW